MKKAKIISRLLYTINPCQAPCLHNNIYYVLATYSPPEISGVFTVF